MQSKPLRRERQTNKWICLRTRCVSCGFSSGFSGILVLGIMILEAVAGGEGQNRRVKVEAWCCSILTAPEGTHLSCSGFAGEASAGGETHYSSSSDTFICVVVGHFLALSVLAILIPGFDQVSGMRLWAGL